MLKKFLIVIITLVLCYSCKTTNNESRDNNEEVKIDTQVTDSYLNQKETISNSVIAGVDPYYGDFASLVLDLIVNKEWKTISSYSDEELYNSYIVDYQIAIEDYCMFILNTGADGSTTNHSLNEVYRAYYTKSYYEDDLTVFQGEYLYPTGETEQFKLKVKETETDLVITRE